LPSTSMVLVFLCCVEAPLPAARELVRLSGVDTLLSDTVW
jgi:hypothetical protein